VPVRSITSEKRAGDVAEMQGFMQQGGEVDRRGFVGLALACEKVITSTGECTGSAMQAA
jgi:hypothetical protein